MVAKRRIVSIVLALLLAAALLPFMANTAHAEEAAWVAFGPNGGEGKMEPVSVTIGNEYTIPACSFKAPEGKVFQGWNTVAAGTAGNYGIWYYPGQKLTINQNLNLYARWNEPLLSVCSYDKTSQKSGQGGQFTVAGGSASYSERLSYGCNNYTVNLDDQFTVTAYPDNGYRFVGWYDAEYIREDAEGHATQDARPYLDHQPLSDDPVYSFKITDNTVLCPVFEKADEIHFVDIGNVWTDLDPLQEAAFTAEINPNEAGLSDFIELADEYWTEQDEDGTVIRRSDDPKGSFVVNKIYRYTAVVKAVGNNVFVPSAGFRFIYGGTTYDWDQIKVVFKDENKIAEISGFIKDQKVKAKQITPNVKLSAASYTYDGRVKTPSVTVKDVDKLLVENQDYTVQYANGRKNAGTYPVTVMLKGNYEGSKTVYFTITKAANTLAVKGKTKAAVVKYKKLKKSPQKIKAAKVIQIKKAGQGTLKFARSSAKKGKKNFKKYFKVNAKSGLVTVKKGLKPGSYKVTVKVMASGNANYKASAWKPATFTIKVK